jgi:apolipoprotein N-acyltransferase
MLLFLPVLSGLLLVASFPKTNQGYLAWVAFIPLIASLLRARKISQAFWIGFVAGWIQIFGLMIWIPAVMAHYGGLARPLAWTGFALMVSMLACFPGAACAATKCIINRQGDVSLLLLPFIWIVLEYAQNFFPFGGLPWLLAGYSQSDYLTLIQIADVTGVYGVSFIILWFNAALAWILVRRPRTLLTFSPLIAAGLLIVACLLYGRISLRQWEQYKPDLKGAMLQQNLSFDETEQVQADKFQSGYVRMADSIKPAAPDLLMIPESPAPVFFQNDEAYRKVLEQLAGRFPLGLVFNNVSCREFEGKQRYFNTAYFLDSRGRLTGAYDKIHLVPFGEYIPLKKIFFFSETISKDIGEFYPGRDYSLIRIGDHTANAIICFEAVFPDLVRRFVRYGSELIINLTNDGWYGDSAAPYQHLAISRWRAIENRRCVLRATNSGISAFIEPSGAIGSSTPILRQAVCAGRFAFISRQTLFTRYGNAFVFLCAIIPCGFLIFGSRRPIQGGF